jgi:broad specificity phosphatase PhoE
MSGAAIWLIRHAESEWNASGRWQGQADPVLSERGREQAQALARELVSASFEALVSSDLRRARETAEIVSRAIGLPLVCDVRLRERDLGDWSGLTTAEIEARWPAELARVRARDPAVRPGGGESIRDAAARARGFFEELARNGAAGRVGIVAHGGVIRALCDVPPLANATWVKTSLSALLDGGAAGRPARSGRALREEA